MNKPLIRSIEPDDALHLVALKMAQAVDHLEALAADATVQFRSGDTGDEDFDRIVAVKLHIRARRLRERVLPSDLFGEPAWAVLLALYVAGLEGKSVSVAGAGWAAGIAPAVALRWLGKLIDFGLVEEIDGRAGEGEADARLTPKGEAAIGQWAESALLPTRFSGAVLKARGGGEA